MGQVFRIGMTGPAQGGAGAIHGRKVWELGSGQYSIPFKVRI